MTHHQRYDLPQPGQRESGRRAQHAAPAKGAGPTVKVLVVGVFVVVTAMILFNAFVGTSEQDSAVSNTANATHEPATESAPSASGEHQQLALGELPPGGPYTEKGSNEYRTVGNAGERMGEGTEHKYTYVVEVEDTIDASQFGGDDAFAAMIDATLNNPKSWIADKKLSFQHVDANKVKNPDFRFQLTSTDTTHEICGNSYNLETSCFYPIGNRVVINEARWVRGAQPFEGDNGAYRQYVINHELGHGIGYARHEPCNEDGGLAPVMMQQTLSMKNSELYRINPEESYKNNDDTCRPNAWPYPNGYVAEMK